MLTAFSNWKTENRCSLIKIIIRVTTNLYNTPNRVKCHIQGTKLHHVIPFTRCNCSHALETYYRISILNGINGVFSVGMAEFQHGKTVDGLNEYLKVRFSKET